MYTVYFSATNVLSVCFKRAVGGVESSHVGEGMPDAVDCSSAQLVNNQNSGSGRGSGKTPVRTVHMWRVRLQNEEVCNKK